MKKRSQTSRNGFSTWPFSQPEAGVQAAKCRQWMQQAGFNNARSKHLVGPESMVVGIK